MNMGAAAFSIINLIVILTFIGMGVFSFVLFVKLATRGIKVLDIYIYNNTSDKAHKD